MDTEQLRQEMGDIWWFHTMELPGGLITPGYDNTPAKLPTLRLPADLRGKTVLDIGACDGFFSFEAERRGAERVLAIDTWRRETGRRGFDLARRALGSRVADLELDVDELTPERCGVFDLVLFLGVLYHVRHPLLTLERVAAVTGEQLILETHVDLLDLRRPAMAYYPGSSFNHDDSNWWGPNPEAVVALLEEVGFTRIEVVAGQRLRSRLYRHARALSCRLRSGDWGYGPWREAVRSGRMVFHAWR